MLYCYCIFVYIIYIVLRFILFVLLKIFIDMVKNFDWFGNCYFVGMLFLKVFLKFCEL